MTDGIPGDEIESREDAQRPVERLVSRIMANRNIQFDNSLYSECDGFEYLIERESDSDDWYIMVNPVEHGYIYDGWWKDSANASLRDAVKEAVRGAMILDG